MQVVYDQVLVYKNINWKNMTFKNCSVLTRIYGSVTANSAIQ